MEFNYYSHHHVMLTTSTVSNVCLLLLCTLPLHIVGKRVPIWPKSRSDYVHPTSNNQHLCKNRDYTEPEPGVKWQYLYINCFSTV